VGRIPSPKRVDVKEVSFALSYRRQWPTSFLAGIDIFAHRPGGNGRGQRAGNTCGSEHGITSGQWRWHTAHFFFPSSYPFFFLFPFQALGPAQCLLSLQHAKRGCRCSIPKEANTSTQTRRPGWKTSTTLRHKPPVTG